MHGLVEVSHFYTFSHLLCKMTFSYASLVGEKKRCAQSVQAIFTFAHCYCSEPYLSPAIVSCWTQTICWPRARQQQDPPRHRHGSTCSRYDDFHQRRQRTSHPCIPTETCGGANWLASHITRPTAATMRIHNDAHAYK
jgi:hypothetical protein